MLENLNKKKAYIKGAGEQASATAHRLFRCGFKVLMGELDTPRMVRRTVSFASAIYQREIIIEGVKGAFYDTKERSFLKGFDWSHIPIFIDPKGQLIEYFKPQIVIDGRILKKNLDNNLKQAPLTLALGPGIFASKDVHWVVETNRGHDLGRIISYAEAAPNTGIPGDIIGHNIDRVLRAPKNGIFTTQKEIGDFVEKGDLLGCVNHQKVRAAISGILRGLIYPGLKVTQGEKIGDIDPRAAKENCYTLSDKSRTISGAVLEIILNAIRF